MRKRFRGNAPLGTTRRVEGGKAQLYAGKSMYPDTPVGGKGEETEGGEGKSV